MAGLQFEDMGNTVSPRFGGTFHFEVFDTVPDASRVEVVVDVVGAEVLIAVASDGAGSATLAQLGSTLACDLFIDEVKSRIEGGDAGSILRIISSRIGWSNSADWRSAGRIDKGVGIQDLACTLLAAVVWGDRAVYFQVGDGDRRVSAR